MMKIKKGNGKLPTIPLGNGKLPPMTRELAEKALSDPFIIKELKILASR
jgi:hypothetical protein